MTDSPDWLSLRRGDAPLLLSIPHAGTDLRGLESRFASSWLARRDADWWLEHLYGFAAGLDATIVRTTVSRSVIDVNRDPSGQSLYPGMATTELCPTTSFDGEPLYLDGASPDAAEIDIRRTAYYEPYHATLQSEIARLRARHSCIVVYDCHSIRSQIPRLFTGVLPQFNIGTNDGRACASELSDALAAVCAASSYSHVVNGRFKGGYITRSLGRPSEGVHAVQMELGCRGYMHEFETVTPDNWPPPYEPTFAEPLRAVLATVLDRCLQFALRPTP
ncbi:N-formylglutamate deformylase [Solimonas marina]|uniref:N-formylglutamate deformylase n=1 Tax=Solimonas marina TaxID=2714601 RepID=A0A970B614_9GAMM|nr:N-formylglutamate deformylase [Solimonas marina]NKF22313.1 N-formylglutamate deformylase [Solimonas marina]